MATAMPNADNCRQLYQAFVSHTPRLMYSKVLASYIYEECDLVHTYIGNHFVRSVLEMIDKWLIRKALISIFTSEGFLIYHFGNKKPKNSYVLANKLNTDILTVPKVEKKSIDL